MAGGEVRAKLVLDKTDFERGIKDAQAQAEEFAKTLGGAFIGFEGGKELAEGLIESFKGMAETAISSVEHLAEFGEQIKNLSAQTGEWTDELQKAGAAAHLVGLTTEDVVSGLAKMEKAIVKGSEAFGQLGLSTAPLRALPRDQAFEQIIGAINKIDDASGRTAARLEIFGKAGNAMGRFTAEGMQAAGVQAEALGQVMSGHTVEAAAKLEEEIKVLSATWQGLQRNMAAAIVDTGLVQDAIEPLTEALGGLSKGLQDSQLEIEGLGSVLRDAKLDLEALGKQVLATPGLGEIFGFASTKAAEFAANLRIIGEEQRRGQALLNQFTGGGGSLTGQLVTGQYRAAHPEEISAEVGTHFAGADEKAAAHKAMLEAGKEAVRQIHDQALTILEIWKEREAESKFLTDQILGQDRARLDLQRQINQAAQDEYNARAQLVGTAEHDAGLRQQIIDAKAQIQGSAADLTRINQLIDQMAGGDSSLAAQLKKHFGEATVKTKEWETELRQAASLISQIGGEWAKALGTIMKDVAGFGSELKNLEGGIAKGGGGFEGFFKGGFSNVLGNISSAIGIAGAAVDIGKAIVGLFSSDPVKDAEKEIAKTIGYDVGYQMSKTLMEQAKATGESLVQVAKEYRAKILAEQAETNLQTMTGGLDEAKKGAEAILGVMGDLSAEARRYAGFMEAGVNDAMMAHGLGYLATGSLRDTKTAEGKSFAAVQTAVGGASEMLAGMGKAGGIDTDYLKNAGGLAGALEKQAEAAALKSGMAPADATKAGFATISPLLTAELNASLQSGKALDANMQALIEEAKKNGVSIVADPMIESVSVQKQILATLQGKGTSGPGGASVSGGGARGANIPHLDTGGLITKGGLAYVDAGETFSGVGGGMSGGLGGGDIHVHVEGPVFGVEDLNAAIERGVTEAFRKNRGDLTYWMKVRLGLL